jgi:hypothetical protein
MASYYHHPTNQEVSGPVIQAMAGVNPDSACLDVLNSLGIFPLKEEMREGLLDNPTPVYVIQGNVAIKSNSQECIPLNQSQPRLESHIKGWFNREVDRVLGNSMLTPVSLLLLGNHLKETSNIIAALNKKAERVAALLEKVQKAKTTTGVKQIYQEFQECEILHGHN